MTRVLIPYSYPTISAQIRILLLSVSRPVSPEGDVTPIRNNISLCDDPHIYYPAVPPLGQRHVCPVVSSGFQDFGRCVILEVFVLVPLLPYDDGVQA
jgi:hypothetical protein